MIAVTASNVTIGVVISMHSLLLARPCQAGGRRMYCPRRRLKCPVKNGKIGSLTRAGNDSGVALSAGVRCHQPLLDSDTALRLPGCLVFGLSGWKHPVANRAPLPSER